MPSVRSLLALASFALPVLALQPARAQGVSPFTFTYQGHLTDRSGAPLDGTFDFTFARYDVATGGTTLGTPIALADVTVVGGLFTVPLDFGDVFSGAGRTWLEVQVRRSGGSYETLAPRQEIMATPYAFALRLPYRDVVGSGGAAFDLTNEGAGPVMALHNTRSGRNAMFGVGGSPVVQEPDVDPLAFGATGGGESFAGAWPGGQGARRAGAVTVPPDSTLIERSGSFGYSALDDGYGVAGMAGGGGVGVYGRAGSNLSSLAGVFQGNVLVQGNLNVTGSKNFEIDHPLDPEHRRLVHACVEAPEMLDLYRGTVALDAQGTATVSLPSWFQALNRDYTYQLTPIGAAAPDLHVDSEIAHNQFRIAGGHPGMKVCWLVTGVRHDPWAAAHPLQVEVPKTGAEPLVAGHGRSQR